MTTEDDFPRIAELRALITDPASPEAYFQNFDELTARWQSVRKIWLDREAELQALDADAWKYLKGELKPLLQTKHETRAWEPLFSKWNQAKAYRALVRRSYTDVAFIPESKVRGQQTPDLRAMDGARSVLCEVKTLHRSDFEIARRAAGAVGNTFAHLNEQFLNKLAATLRSAKKQMTAFDGSAHKIAYVVVNYDDNLHQYADEYRSDIDRYLAESPIEDLEIIFDIDGPFYTATR